jgi:MFS family permease
MPVATPLTPHSQVSVTSAILFFGFSIGTALAPNLAAFFVFRILTAFQGTAFLVIGSSVIGDIFKPVCSNRMSAL